MEKAIRYIIGWFARIFRGSSYQLDPGVSTRSLVDVSIRRGISLIRCLLRGYAISPRKLFFVGASVSLRNKRLVQIGRGATLGNCVTIDGLSREGVIIGKGASIGPYSIIEATGVIQNLGEGCRIGENSGIGAFSFIGAAGGVEVGDNVIMGQYVSFHSENHCFDSIEIPIRLQGVKREGIIIEDDCWVGAKVTFLDGAHVGKGSVIAAGAVVRGYIPPYSVAAGVPARIIKNRKAQQDA